jgi:hypothetical protein
LAWIGAAVFRLPVVAQDDDLVAGLAVEEHLLAQDIDSYRRVRGEEQRERSRVEELEERFVQWLDGRDATLDQLATLEEDLQRARGNALLASRKAEQLTARILDRFRRIDGLHTALSQASDARRRSGGVLAGRWDVHFLPLGQRGTFDLRLDGTLISGTYLLQGEFFGSLRGTLVGATVNLERIDSERGFDMILDASLQANGELRGSWRATHLTSGGPSGGTWVAVRAENQPSRP